jgi:hypothetical protein
MMDVNSQVGETAGKVWHALSSAGPPEEGHSRRAEMTRPATTKKVLRLCHSCRKGTLP